MLNDSSKVESKFATKSWYIIDSQAAKDKYDLNSSIKFEAKALSQVGYSRYSSKYRKWYTCCI